MDGVVKVADFGLSEDIYTQNYFRQDKIQTEVKLPVRWMAPESIEDLVFTEKTDVVSCLQIMSKCCYCHSDADFPIECTRSLRCYMHVCKFSMLYQLLT